MKKTKKTKEATHSIKTSLIGVILALVAVPLIISIAVNFISSMEEAVENAESLNLQAAEIIEGKFVGIIDQNMMTLQTAADAEDCIRYLDAQEADRDALEPITAIYLKDIDDSFGDGNSLALSDTTGQQLIRTIGEPVNVADREYFKKAVSGTIYMSDAMVSKSTNSYIFTMAVPVMNEDGTEITGILQRNYDLTDMHDILVNASDKNTEIMLVDRTGAVAADSREEITSATELKDVSSERFFTEKDTSEKGTYEEKTDDGTKIFSYWVEPKSQWTIVIERDKEAMIASAKRIAIIIVIVGIIMLVIAAAIAFYMANSFTAPVLRINETLGALADGSFERIDKYADRKDEFGEMVRSTNSVINRLDEIVSDIKKASSQVGESASDLAQTAGQISQTTDGVSEAVQEVAKGATEQADTIQRASESVGELSDAIQSVADNSEQLAATAAKMNDASQSSAQQLKKLSANMDNMRQAMEDINSGISDTNLAVESIGSKVDGITSIASQTNLLALNASIEAARAGEAGRGFAVVAEEIGTLATQSASIAEEIRAEMERLTSTSQSAMQKSGEVQGINKEVSSVLSDTVETINNLIEGVDVTVDGVTTISGLAEECAANKTLIVDSMDSLSAISEENAAATEETSASMEELNATVNVLASSADNMSDIAKKLDEDLQFFKV
ncbi:MAG: HAMP domain-containing protein [Lachnospiraceae bacterium]|nr:HAMP domain-containing protein [Lachnospiraceae bacterium]